MEDTGGEVCHRCLPLSVRHFPCQQKGNRSISGMKERRPSRDSRDAYLRRGGQPVADGFSYSSDTNPEQLDARGLQTLLQMAYA